MPNKDPVKRKAQLQAWNDRTRRQGYYKALSDRRAHEVANGRVLRAAIEDILGNWSVLNHGQVQAALRRALKDAPPVGKPKDYMPDPSTYTYVPRPVKRLPCGHPQSAVVQDREGTAYCSECAREAHEPHDPRRASTES